MFSEVVMRVWAMRGAARDESRNLTDPSVQMTV